MGFNRAHRAQRFMVLPLAHPFDININSGTSLQHERMRSRALALSATLALVLLPSQVPAAALPLLRTEWSASAAALGWRGAAAILGLIALLALPIAVASTRGIAHIPGERAHLDLRVLRNAPLVRTIAAYTGHSWELFIVRAWLAAFLAAAFALRGMSPTESSATASQWAAIMLALGVPGGFLGGSASDRVGRTKSALLYALASGAISIGFGTVLFAPLPALFAIGAIYGAIVAADPAGDSTAVNQLPPAGRLRSAHTLHAV